MATFRFYQSGHDVTGTNTVAGYAFRDFFDCDIQSATDAELGEAYRGPDCDGVEVRWFDCPAA